MAIILVMLLSTRSPPNGHICGNCTPSGEQWLKRISVLAFDILWTHSKQSYFQAKADCKYFNCQLWESSQDLCLMHPTAAQTASSRHRATAVLVTLEAATPIWLRIPSFSLWKELTQFMDTFLYRTEHIEITLN